MSAFSFSSADDYRRRDEHDYVDYARNLPVAIAYAMDAFQREDHPAVFLWLLGHAGTGKTYFADALAWHLLQAAIPTSLLKINCMDLAVRDEEAVRPELRRIDDRLQQADFPLILLLDETEAVTRERRQGRPAETLACYWAINLLRVVTETRQKVIVLAATNFPEQCDMTFVSEMGPKLYFPRPSVGAATEMLANENVQEAATVADTLFRLCEQSKLVPMVRPILGALKRLPKDVWGTVSAEAFARLLRGMGNYPTVRAIDSFEEAHATWIEGADTSRQVAGMLKAHSEDEEATGD